MLHEECGVFGVFGACGAAGIVRTGLAFLQHRGQEGCGIAAVGADGRFFAKRDLGLVSGVFPDSVPDDGSSVSAIGHVRYGTSGGGEVDNVQPFLFCRHGDSYATAHNGNIANALELKASLSARGILFHSSSDSEIFGALIGKNLPRGGEISPPVVARSLNLIDGAFSLLVLTRDAMFACRDMYGLRPLCIGRLGEGWVAGSETCALEAVGAVGIRDVRPGEIIRMSARGIETSSYSASCRNAMCAMEYIYFARPDSVIEGVNVHLFRKESGRIIARESPCDADMVIGVPDSGLSAAMGYSLQSGIPMELGIVKSSYIARTFIQPTQEMRISGVRMKLSPVNSLIRGKRLVVIDDSIVRGTTSRQLVRMLREAGAAEVHMRISSPPLRYPCFYGVDISTREELISASHTPEEVCRFIGADSLAFISEEGLMEAGRRSDMCLACFSGRYPTDLYSNG